MLTVRQGQMDTLAESMMRRYEQRVAERLRAQFPAKLDPVSDEDLREHVRTGATKAKGYGITAESDMTRYLEYTVEYGPEFDATPWARRVLADEKLSGREKMDRLDGYTTYELRP